MNPTKISIHGNISIIYYSHSTSVAMKEIIFYPLRNLDIINLNRQKLNPYSEFPNNALLNLQINVRNNRHFNHGNDKIE